MMTKRAFFNNPLCPGGNISVEGSPHFRGPLGLVPIEILDGVRTGCRTISATDATVIDLGNQSLFVDIGGIDRTDLGARGIVTVHTGSREEPGFDSGILPFNVRDQFDPVDGSTLPRFLRADDGDIVFRLTGDDAGLAGGASVQVDDHAPPGSVSSVVSVGSCLFHRR
jgi:hypothetical protein